MKHLLVSFLLLIFSQNLLATDAQIGRINRLVKDIRIESDVTNASDESLQQVIDHLEQALDLLKQDSNNGGYKKECFDYAYAKYYLDSSSSVATDKAIAACKKVEDLSILKFSYDKYYLALSATNAMDKAVQIAVLPLKGKMDMLTFAYDKFYLTLNADSSMTKAGQGIARVKKNSLQCLQDLYTNYYRTDSSDSAMTKAINGCAQ